MMRLAVDLINYMYLSLELLESCNEDALLTYEAADLYWLWQQDINTFDCFVLYIGLVHSCVVIKQQLQHIATSGSVTARVSLNQVIDSVLLFIIS